MFVNSKKLHVDHNGYRNVTLHSNRTLRHRMDRADATTWKRKVCGEILFAIVVVEEAMMVRLKFKTPL